MKWLVRSLLAVVATYSVLGITSERDIIGFHLGDTEAEVVSLLTTKGVPPPYELRVVSFNYSDDVQTFRTPERTLSISAIVDDSYIYFEFTQAPGDQRVVSIDRDYEITNPPLLTEVRAGLVDKYGTPDGESNDGYTQLYAWNQPNVKPCFQSDAWKDTNSYETTNYPSLHAPVINTAINHYQGVRADFDINKCGSVVIATMTPNDPVKKVKVRMLDYGAWGRDRSSLDVLLINLAAKAKEKRIGAGKVPTF